MYKVTNSRTGDYHIFSRLEDADICIAMYMYDNIVHSVANGLPIGVDSVTLDDGEEHLYDTNTFMARSMLGRHVFLTHTASGGISWHHDVNSHVPEEDME